MKIYPVYLMLLISGLLVSCGNEKKEEGPEVVTVTAEEPEVTKEVAMEGPIDVKFNDEDLQVIFKEYIELKTALVYSNPAQAAAEASNLLKALTTKGAKKELLQATQAIINAKHIDEQRTAFVQVTQHMETMLEGAIESGTVYKQYCPMAFGNKGAFWLSESKEIRNPYFGSKMLNCGRIDAELK